MRLAVATGLLLLPLGALASCSLAEPLDGYAGGGHDDASAAADAGGADGAREASGDGRTGACAAAEKTCSGVCQSTFDPKFGCAAASCDPCAFANGVSDGCDSTGRCRLGACIAGFGDCNAQSDDGCEAQLSADPQHCGACNKACALTHAEAVCTAGACGIASCSAGFADCNANATDGCEVSTQTDVAHCGGCATPCPTVGNTTFACVSGSCKVNTCALGYVDCDHVDTNGCECGFANALVHCADPNAGDAGADASSDASLDASGAAACVFAGCSGTFADCNGNLAHDGCEVDTATDALNCGACGFSCEQGACVAGRCQPKQIIGSQGNPGQLVVDLDYAYWSNYGAGGANGSIYRVRKDGLNPTLIAGGTDATQNSAWGIATDDSTSRVFWTTYSATSHVDSALKVSSAPTVVASTTGRLRGAALDGNYLYWANYEGSTVNRIDVTNASAAVETVAQGANVSRPNTIAFDATSVFWTNEGTAGAPSTGGAPTSVANTGTLMAITKASIGTASPVVTTLAVQQDKPRSLAVDDTYVYWTNVGSAANSGSIARIPKDGSAGQVRTVIASGLGTPRELALCTGTGCANDPYLYVTTFAAGTILRIAKNAPASSTPTVVASNQKGPLGIATDAKYIFWANYGTSGQADGTIMKLVKQP